MNQQNQYSLALVASNRELFTEILLKTLDINHVNQAQNILASFDQENTEHYCLLLSEELSNEALGATPSREIAGQQLKNMLSAKGETERISKTQRWMLFQKENRQRIIENVKQALRSMSIPVANSAAASLSAIGVIEIPARHGSDIIDTLFTNIHILNQTEEELLPRLVALGNDQNAQIQNPGMLENCIQQHRLNMKLKRASITCLSYLCEDLPQTSLSEFQDTLLTILVSDSLNYTKAYRDESDDEAEVEALKALYNLLPAVHQKFNERGPRQLILAAVMNPLQAYPQPNQTDDKFFHRRMCYQCLIRIADLYYPYLAEHVELLFMQTMETIQKDTPEIVPLAIELWTVIAEFEASLIFQNTIPKIAQEQLSPYFKDRQPRSLCVNLCERAADQLTKLMFTILLDIPDDFTADSWDARSAAVMLVSTVYGTVHSQDLFNMLSTFASQNLVILTNNGANVLTAAQLEQVPPYNSRNTAVYVIGLMIMGTKTEMKNIQSLTDLQKRGHVSPEDAQYALTIIENAKNRRKLLCDYVLNVFPILLQGMLEDDVPVVRNTCAWTVQWICSELSTELCPQNIYQHKQQHWPLLLNSLHRGLTSNNMYVAKHSATAIKHMAKNCSADIAKKPMNYVSNMLEELFDPLFRVIELGADGTASRVAQIATLAMEKIIQNTGAASRQFLQRKVKDLMEYMVGNPNQPEQTIIAELMVIRSSTLRMEYSIQTHKLLLYKVLENLVQSTSIVLQEQLLQTLYVLGYYLNPVETEIFGDLVPYLIKCLQSDSIPGIQNQALEVIAMFAMLYTTRFIPFIPHLLPDIIRIFEHHYNLFQQSSFSFDRKVFPGVMDTLSDIAISATAGMVEYLRPSLNIAYACMKMELPQTETLEEEKEVVKIYTSAMSLTMNLITPFSSPNFPTFNEGIKAQLEKEDISNFILAIHSISSKIILRCTAPDMPDRSVQTSIWTLLESDQDSTFSLSLVKLISTFLRWFPNSRIQFNFTDPESSLAQFLRYLENIIKDKEIRKDIQHFLHLH